MWLNLVERSGAGPCTNIITPTIICSTTKESQNKASPAQISTLLDLLPVNHHTECISTPQRATFRRPHFDTNPPRST